MIGLLGLPSGVIRIEFCSFDPESHPTVPGLPARPVTHSETPPAMIRLVNARKNYGRQTLYDGVDASINRGDRIGLLGKNGAGKSTLFKVLTGEESLDGGELLRDRKCSVGYLPQEVHPLREGTIFERMLGHRSEERRVGKGDGER